MYLHTQVTNTQEGLFLPSGLTQKWSQGFSVTCCLAASVTSELSRLPAISSDICHCGWYYTIFFPSAFADMLPVNLTHVRASCKNKISKYIFYVRNMALNCMRPSAACTEETHGVFQAVCPQSISTTKVCPAIAPVSTAGMAAFLQACVSAQITENSHFFLPVLLFRVIAGLSSLTGKH